MVRKIVMVFGMMAGLSVLAYPAGATSMQYRFINPSFGGDPGNGPFLLNEASAQNNKHPDPTPAKSALDQFNQTLNNQILYRLSAKLVDAAFGESGLQPGRYQMGSFVVDVATGADGLTINILDTSSGAATTVQVPFY
jgi:curli production assembly/transport component CsgF